VGDAGGQGAERGHFLAVDEGLGGLLEFAGAFGDLAFDLRVAAPELQVAVDGEAGEETSKLQKALAAQEAKKQKPAPTAPPTPPETDAARFYRLLTAAQDVAALDRIMDDARATLKGADLHSAEQYAIDRRAALAA